MTTTPPTRRRRLVDHRIPRSNRYHRRRGHDRVDRHDRDHRDRRWRGTGPDGSGCTPGDGDVLPDGRWFGFPSAREADSFSFDLACWFTGDDAAAAATEDGAESPPPNDGSIRTGPNHRLLIPSHRCHVELLADHGDPARPRRSTTRRGAPVGEPIGRPGAWSRSPTNWSGPPGGCPGVVVPCRRGRDTGLPAARSPARTRSGVSGNASNQTPVASCSAATTAGA